MNKIPFTKVQDAWLGLDSLRGRFIFGTEEIPLEGIIPPKQIVDIQTINNALFRSERFFVKRDIAKDFLIHSLFLGTQNCGTINNQPLIADIFATDFDQIVKMSSAIFDGKVLQLIVEKNAVELLGSTWKLPALQPGIQFTMCVENIGDVPHRFLAAFYGQAVF